MAMLTAVVGELVVARDRIDTLERLLESAGVIERARIESFEPAPEQAEERLRTRQRIIEKAFRPLREAAERDLEAVAGRDDND